MGLSGDTSAPDPESSPKGLIIWREAVSRSHTAAQLAMSLYMLESSIAWDKSIMKAVRIPNQYLSGFILQRVTFVVLESQSLISFLSELSVLSLWR